MIPDSTKSVKAERTMCSTIVGLSLLPHEDSVGGDCVPVSIPLMVLRMAHSVAVDKILLAAVTGKDRNG